MGWLSGFSHRKSHVINQQNGAGTGYQVGIKVYFGPCQVKFDLSLRVEVVADGIETVGGVSFGKIYCNSNCKKDFGDVRFTEDDGVTLLSYWIQEKVDGNYALIWVKISDNLSLGNVTIYIYYGKADAMTTSDISKTFNNAFIKIDAPRSAIRRFC